MSGAGRVIDTSTPNQGGKETSILREKNWISIIGNDETFDENDKVKIQTIEPMKIAANHRRRRLALGLSSDEDETLVKDFEKLKVPSSKYFFDDRLKLTRQHLITRKTSVLCEENHNIIKKSEETFDEDKVKIRTDKFKSKENRRRHLSRDKRVLRYSNDDPSEKRRIQAIEAMQIAEQRRRRLALGLSSDEDETLVKDFEKLKVRPSEYLPDGRLKLTRQQLITRKLKRKRIEQYLKEQEARKKKQLENKKRKSVYFKKEPETWTPRPNNESRPKIFQYSKKVMKVSIEEETTSKNAKNNEKHQIVVQQKNVDIVEPLEEDQKKTKKPILYRYTKDELRELNMLGYYFM